VNDPSPALSDAKIERIAVGVLDRSLPKPEWTHAAHFGATLWLLRHRPDLRLEHDMRAIIRAYNQATSTPNTDTTGYHETITQASIRAARDFLGPFPSEEPLCVILAALMASPLGEKSWLLSYWTRERLFSVQARRSWLEPDLAPLPF
jgi:hypothetical protein